MDDMEVIQMLRALGRDDRLPMRDATEQILDKGRRAKGRRRALMVPAWSMAAIGVAALVFAMTHVRSNDRPLFLAPAGLSIQQSQPSSTQAPNDRALQEALSDDFLIDYQGEVTVRVDSPAAEGLPTGLTVWTQIFELQQSTTSGDLAQFCKPMVEKNVIFSACTQRVLPGGQTVHVQQSRTGPGGVTPGRSPYALASDGIRVLFEQPDGDLVIVDLSTQESESNSTHDRRAAAQAWLDDMTSRLGNAATDPRVGESDLRRGPTPSTPLRGQVE